MPVVSMPDGARVSFPDEMPPEQIRGLIAQKFPDVAMAHARERLGEGLRRGESGEGEIYRTAAFRSNLGVPKAGATDAAIQGATMGWGDEFSAAARAPIDMALRGEGFQEAYQHNLAAERDRLARYAKENPKAALAAEVAGSLVGGAPALRRGGGMTHSISTPGGTTRITIGDRLLATAPTGGPITTGAAMGAIGGAGGSEGDLAQRGVDAATGGLIGGAIGAAARGAGRVIGGKGPSAQATSSELIDEAKRGYRSDEIQNFRTGDQHLFGDLSRFIADDLTAAGFDRHVAAKTHGILNDVISGERTVLTGPQIHSLQKSLGKAAASIDPSERLAARTALNQLNDHIENLGGGQLGFSQAMREANANYSAGKTAESLDARVAAKKLRAEAQNSGMNAASLIRQDMATIASNPRLSRGMRPDEVAQVKQIAEGTTGENLIRKAGNLMGGGGGLGAVVSGAAGYAAGGLPGIAIPAGGMLLKGLSNRMTLANAEKLSEMIRSRAPLASATSKFEERAAQFKETRNSKTAAAAALAARNLSTNLNDAGISISAADLMRIVQQ